MKMKKWHELTHVEIDALMGWDLSEAVGEAMGINRPVVVTWHPHEDANQALEVWGALLRLDEVYMLKMGTKGAIVYDAFRPERRDTKGTFCEAICRAYLKARQAEPDDG